MATILQLRRGTTTQHNAFTGAVGEVTVDTTKDTVVVHDGTTQGGIPLATEAYVTTQIQTKDNSDEITEGSTNLYFTDTRARGAVSVTDSGGDGSLSYNNSTGVFTFTGPSASDVRAHFSAGTGITITDGAVAVDSTIATKTYADDAATTAVAAVIDAAPATLDTLNELAAALGDDANFSSTITTSIGTKLNSSAVSAFGLTLVDDADAAAARTTLGLGTSATTAASAYATAAQGTKADNALPAADYTANDVLTKLKTVDGAGSGLDADLLDGNSSAYFLAAADYTANDVLTKIKTVDGTGSGLDADLLGGNSSAHYRINIYDSAGNLLN